MIRKKVKIILAAVIGSAMSLMFLLNIGFYLDREWQDLYIFIKYRPALKMLFYAPRGEADTSAIPGREGYLTPEEEKEENLYIEFVEENQAYRRSMFLPIPASWLIKGSSG